MNSHVQFALAHPVFDPEKEVLPEHFWAVSKRITAGLTCNIGME
jgi:hypothetical protein